MADLLPELRKELGGRATPGLDKLSPAQQKQLTAVLQEARHHQQQVLNRAMADTLHHIPAILRAPIRAFFRD